MENVVFLVPLVAMIKLELYYVVLETCFLVSEQSERDTLTCNV